MRGYPLVSILIPLYNAEKYFSETMESLLAQTYKNIEIIIVDDGSTDNSLKIARQYEEQHKHIKVYTQENSGGQVARNRAFELSKGDYIQHFDADDIMHPDKIASQMEVLREYGFQDDIVATGKWMMFRDSIENTVPNEQTINKSYDDTLLFLSESWGYNKEFILGQSWLISRILRLKVGKWNERLSMNQDGEFFCRVAYNSNKIVFVEESVVYYRRGIPDSISMNTSLAITRSYLDSFHCYYDTLKDDLDKKSLRKSLAMLYSWFYRSQYPLNTEMKEEVVDVLKSLGYDGPILEFKKSCRWVVSIFGVDAGLYIWTVKKKIVNILCQNFNLKCGS